MKTKILLIAATLLMPSVAVAEDLCPASTRAQQDLFCFTVDGCGDLKVLLEPDELSPRNRIRHGCNCESDDDCPAEETQHPNIGTYTFLTVPHLGQCTSNMIARGDTDFCFLGMACEPGDSSCLAQAELLPCDGPRVTTTGLFITEENCSWAKIECADGTTQECFSSRVFGAALVNDVRAECRIGNGITLVLSCG